MIDRKLPIAVLISGGGTTLRNLLRRIDAGTLDVDVKLVVSSSSQAKGLQFAADAGIPSRVIRLRDMPTPEAFSDEIFDACRAAGVELVVLGGFLKHLLIPADFSGSRDQHPSGLDSGLLRPRLLRPACA